MTVAKARRAPVAKAVPDGHVAVYDKDGRLAGYARPGDIADPASAQARNRDPVNAGGTTGMGQPRVTGPAGSLPGDPPGRQREPGIRTREECIAAAGRTFAGALRDIDELYAGGGAIAVARAAYVPGGPSVGELAAGWERIARAARETAADNRAT